MVVVAVAAILAAGLGTGVALAADTTDLDVADAEINSARETIDELNAELAAAEEQIADVSEALTAAKDRAAAAEEESNQSERRLNARSAKLDERATALKRREDEVATREDEVAAAEEALEEAPPTTADGATGGDFDRAYALDTTSDILEDIRVVDERLRDGIMVASALSLLSDSYGRLLSAGKPPGVDEADYHARVTTLQSFAGQAAEIYYDDPIEGSAKYEVVRQETGVLLDTLNTALGTQLRLP